MKNLKAYNSDATKAYKDAVQRKGTSDAKDCLLQIETKVCDAYQKYKDCFDANSLCNIQESDFAVSADEKRHLLDMYSYRSKIIKDIIVSEHPMGKNEETHINALVELIKFIS